MTDWRVALLYNLKHSSILGADDAEDALAEFAIPETVQSLERALLAAGHEVICLEADITLFDTIRETNPDICFNIARGLDGRNRLAQIPALLEMLGIPFTGSDARGHSLASDKELTRNLWQATGLPVTQGQVFRGFHEPFITENNPFPLFVKPLYGESGAGVDANSIVHNQSDLRTRVEWITQTYQQSALVERYLPGREFAVGILGNQTSNKRQQWSDLYDTDGFHIFPILEINPVAADGHRVYDADARLRRPGSTDAPQYICPANISPQLKTKLQQLALDAFKTVGALDTARVDLRLDEHDEPYLLEIDTMPNFDPYLSDFCLMAKSEGISYDNLINEILQLAMERNFLIS